MLGFTYEKVENPFPLKRGLENLFPVKMGNDRINTYFSRETVSYLGEIRETGVVFPYQHPHISGSIFISLIVHYCTYTLHENPFCFRDKIF